MPCKAISPEWRDCKYLILKGLNETPVALEVGELCGAYMEPRLKNLMEERESFSMTRIDFIILYPTWQVEHREK